jgi:hypothetical protein
MISSNSCPDFLLFAQHGWADDSQDISRLAGALATEKTVIIAPSLGKLKTWLRIEPLIQNVETFASQTIKNYPETPMRIMGHSLGGLIWLEVLNRHPEWWQHVDSLIVLGSPIGGADLARIIDPLAIGIGIAGDLGKNRRHLAEKIAQNIPTLTIASDLDSGSDGMITVETTKFAYCKYICLSDIVHAALKCHPRLVPIIQDFWTNPQITTPPPENLATKLIKRLQIIPGMTDGHRRDFTRAKVYLSLTDGITIRTWKNPFGIDHVFVADKEDKCLYSGYVGWLHSQALRQTLAEIEQQIDCLKHRDRYQD